MIIIYSFQHRKRFDTEIDNFLFQQKRYNIEDYEIRAQQQQKKVDNDFHTDSQVW